MTTEVEVGTLKEIESQDIRYRYHKSGNPIDEAYMIQRLMESDDYTQKKVANILEISQGQVSKRLRLLNLLPELQEQLKKGELRASTAYAMSKLPRDEQRKLASKEHLYLKDVKAKRRELAVTNELKNFLEQPIELPATQGKWRKARKKPVVVEVREVEPKESVEAEGTRKGEIVETLNGTVVAYAGEDYIIRGVDGELYPIDKKIFHKTYEFLEENQ